MTANAIISTPPHRPILAQISAKSEQHAYVVAFACVAIALSVITLYPPLLSRGAFLVLLAAVTITAWCGGLWPALLATALSALAAAFSILPPIGQSKLSAQEDVVRLIIFIVVAVIVSAMYESRTRAVRHSEAGRTRLLYALEKARMGIWEANLQTGEVWWSPNVLELFGESEHTFSRTFESFIGRIHPDDQDFVKHAITRPAAGGTDFEIDHRIVHNDGSIRRVKMRGRVIRNDHGSAINVMAAVLELNDFHSSAPESAEKDDISTDILELNAQPLAKAQILASEHVRGGPIA